MDLSALTGLAAVPGRALQIKIAATAAVVLIGATLYAVHYFTVKGYEQAAAECAQRALQADVHRLEMEKSADEDRRDIAVWNAVGRQRIKTGAAAQREEVIRDNDSKPAPPVCTLDADGLRLWNAPTGPDPAMRVRPGGADADRSGTGNAAAVDDGPPGHAQAEQDGQQGGLRSAAEGRAGAGKGIPSVSDIAGRAGRFSEWEAAVKQKLARPTPGKD